MFRLPKKKDKHEPLDDLIAQILIEMHAKTPYSDDYPAMLDYLERLTSLKAKKARERVSSDTLVTTGGYVLSVLILVAYEQKHVMTSKAFPLIMKPKLP